MMIILYNSHLTTSRYLLSLWKAKSSLASLNSKNNSPVMLFRTIVMHWICFLSSVVIRMDMDWNLKTVWPTFSSFTKREWESLSLGFTVTPVKITKKVEVLPDEICLISVTFFLTRRNIFCRYGRINLKPQYPRDITLLTLNDFCLYLHRTFFFSMVIEISYG